ncbi:MAG: antibiotic biosynthesis monooxygenase [Proteobacteria bacterium]|nr:antibiotic biosynthesis monooxygenase [Pseudomonadota bacterium]
MIVVAKMTALNGKEADMEKALLDMIPLVKEEVGTITYTLHKDQNNPRVFLFYEKYTDLDALVAHSSTEYFKALFKTLKPMLDGKPEISMFTELAGIS